MEIKSKALIESLKLKVGDHQAHYLKAGSGPPVVLIHGGASDSQDWVSTMAALSHHYSLYAPDLTAFSNLRGETNNVLIVFELASIKNKTGPYFYRQR